MEALTCRKLLLSQAAAAPGHSNVRHFTFAAEALRILENRQPQEKTWLKNGLLRMPIPSDVCLMLVELTHRLSSLLQRPSPLDALAAHHAARVNATALLTLKHARAALDEPVTELPAYNLDPPAWCPSESLGERLQARAQARDSASAFTPRMPHP